MTNEQVALIAAASARASGGYAAARVLETAEEFLTWLDSRTIRQDSIVNRPEPPAR